MNDTRKVRAWTIEWQSPIMVAPAFWYVRMKKEAAQCQRRMRRDRVRCEIRPTRVPERAISALVGQELS